MHQGFVCGKRFLLGLAVATVMLTASAAHAEGERPDCYILSVGIDKYERGPLQGCVNDANNMARQFQSQDGKLFGKVVANVLLDGDATKSGIDQGMHDLKRVGKAGDYVVLFLSGHGGRANNDKSWFFVPQDSRGDAAGQLQDRQILTLSDQLAGEGKKVFVIIDACFAGQLRVNARALLNKNYDQGGVILMVSSMPGQVSAALGKYSAFAQAVVEGLAGRGDLDGDGYVTLREVRRFAYHRVYDLVRKGNQDGEIDYSISISENLRLAQASTESVPAAEPQVAVAPVVNEPAPAAPAARQFVNSEWRGNENLANFGGLIFRFQGNNQVVMTDAQGTTSGGWARNGNLVTLAFNNGQVLYVGTINGDRITGTARGSRGNTWTWSVAMQNAE